MIEDNQSETIQKMRSLLMAAKAERKQPVVENQSEIASVDFNDWVPECKDGEFLLRITFENVPYLCCLHEPTWREAASIEMYAFRKTYDGREYFAGEYERRELLKNAIRWIADSGNKQIHRPDITQLSYEFVVQLWEQASQIFFVQLNEAQALYASAKSFFAGEMGHPVHPIILDVDGIIRHMFVFNSTEWNAVKMSDYERYQIVWSAYHESELSTQSITDVDSTTASDPRLRTLLNRMAQAQR